MVPVMLHWPPLWVPAPPPPNPELQPACLELLMKAKFHGLPLGLFLWWLFWAHTKDPVPILAYEMEEQNWSDLIPRARPP